MVTRIGILLAAGRSRRMGQLKQLLPWGSAQHQKPLIAAAFDAIQPACGTVIVVVGHQSQRVIDALAPRDFVSVQGREEGAMFESLCAGIRRAREIDVDADVLIQPGDHPNVSAATLNRLTQEARRQPHHVVIPQYEGRGGHPVFVPSALLEPLLHWKGSDGLRGYWKTRPETCHRVDVDDPGVVRDLDTPEDYVRKVVE